MAPNEEEKIRDLLAQALERDPQRFLVWAGPNTTGMSYPSISFFWLLKSLQKEKERE
jgi:hypothetical protein